MRALPDHSLDDNVSINHDCSELAKMFIDAFQVSIQLLARIGRIWKKGSKEHGKQKDLGEA